MVGGLGLSMEGENTSGWFKFVVHEWKLERQRLQVVGSYGYGWM